MSRIPPPVTLRYGEPDTPTAADLLGLPEPSQWEGMWQKHDEQRKPAVREDVTKSNTSVCRGCGEAFKPPLHYLSAKYCQRCFNKYNRRKGNAHSNHSR